MTKGKTVKIGIMPEEEFRAMMLRASKGLIKRPKNAPKIYFSSIRALAEVLSDRNRALIRLIAETSPASLSDLARETGRDKGNLTRTLQRLAQYGIVELHRENKAVRPVAKYTEFLIAA